MDFVGLLTLLDVKKHFCLHYHFTEIFQNSKRYTLSLMGFFLFWFGLVWFVVFFLISRKADPWSPRRF